MKPGDNHELLDTILDDAEGHAPSADQMLADIRGEKRARANRRMMVGTTVSALLVALFISQSSGFRSIKPEAIQPPATNLTVAPSPEKTVKPPPESKWQIARVSDQQLLDLLVDTPVALTQDADGRQQLMMVVAAED